VHIASSGGVWAGVVHGFGGMRETGEYLKFNPNLPEKWDALRFKIRRHGSVLAVDLRPDGCVLEVTEGDGVWVQADDGPRLLTPGEELFVERAPRQ